MAGLEHSDEFRWVHTKHSYALPPHIDISAVTLFLPVAAFSFLKQH